MVWQDAILRRALLCGDFGQASRRIRALAGLRQDDLATITGLTQSFLSMLESGARRLASIDRISGFLDGLGVPAELRITGNTQAPALTDAESPATSDMLGDLRELASQAATQSLRFADRFSTSNVTDDDIEDLTYALADIATAYVHAPLHPLLHDLLGTRDRVFALLDGHQAPHQTRELFLLAGTSCLLLAHASQNLGDEKAAMAQIRAAWTCAERADHHGLRAWSKGTAALIAEWSPRRQAALTYTREALRHAPRGESRIRIAAIQARAAARIGDRPRALAALDILRTAREQPAEPEGLGRFGGLLTFPEAKQEYYIGGTYTLLGEHALAEQHATAALTLYENGAREDRSYGDEALARLDITTARLAAGELEGAGDQLHYLFQLPPELRIRQLGTAMHRISGLLQQPQLAGNHLARELAQAARDYQAIDTTTKVLQQ
ncbi:helix-turn-helix domain-containing protein [Streptomyces sp. ERV7]|uniref:helix-turn-helix domain-containing protein n=1 Tax=Streptomyces sp. ERV7 TaxID=1322334 RepID=UPI000A8DA8C6|nr:helix-turn-helix transcriptional regulator [Streptomyces sp. ERV7]